MGKKRKMKVAKIIAPIIVVAMLLGALGLFLGCGGGQTTWTVQLDGTAIGGTTFTVTEQYFEEGVAHHDAATFNDSAWGSGYSDTYSGMELWLLVGRVDDAVEHGQGAFNDALAASGYLVKVIDAANDNYSTTLTSQDVARSNKFIIANLKNGAALPSGEGPLRLVGSGVSITMSTKHVVKIQLLPGTP